MPNTPHTPSFVFVQDLALLRLNVKWTDGLTDATTPPKWSVQLAEGPLGQIQALGVLRIEGAWGSMQSEAAALPSDEAAKEHHRSGLTDGRIAAARIELILHPILWAYTRQTLLPVLSALPTGPTTDLPREPPIH